MAAFWRLRTAASFRCSIIVLHEWVWIFGDSLFAMRAMSAALGTLAIMLLFIAVREISAGLVVKRPLKQVRSAGAFAALIYALNLTIVVSDRTAREFPLLTAAELAQIIFFVRAQRHGDLDDYLVSRFSPRSCFRSTTRASFLLSPKLYGSAVCCSARWAGSARAARSRDLSTRPSGDGRYRAARAAAARLLSPRARR